MYIIFYRITQLLVIAILFSFAFFYYINKNVEDHLVSLFKKMEENLDSISCLVCCNAFLSETTSSGLVDRRPAVICSNGHSLCMTCAGTLLEDEEPKCPTCRQELLAQPIINRSLMGVVDGFVNRISHVPEIEIADLKVMFSKRV